MSMPRAAMSVATSTRQLLWAAASFLVLLSGQIAPTPLGIAFVVLQAVVVALLGELQYLGLRRPTAAVS